MALEPAVLAAGDTFIVRDLLQGEDAGITIDDVLAEVPLGPLFHENGRVLNRPGAFVAAPVEGSGPATKPYLRCPSSVGVVPRDEGLVMRKLRLAASRAAGVAFNHAKVQLYETRGNRIEFHADKVLDLCEDDAFVSFRLGATRVFSLRSKERQELVHHIRATSNSAIVVGPRTNREWVHGVLPDGRPAERCAEDEFAFGGRSLSIVFRRAVTFWRGDGLLFGAGAKFRTEEALEAALQAARAQGEDVGRLGELERLVARRIREAWGRDNKSWTASRVKLYGPVIEGSVAWLRTPDMEPPAPTRPSPQLSAPAAPPSRAVARDLGDAAAGCAKRDGVAAVVGPTLLWGLLAGALCLATLATAGLLAAPPSAPRRQ